MWLVPRVSALPIILSYFLLVLYSANLFVSIVLYGAKYDLREEKLQTMMKGSNYLSLKEMGTFWPW